MAQPYVGEIRMFAGNFAPAGWMFCEGQSLAIGENETLFNLIGNTYGGDGSLVFSLPDLRGRIPVHQGNGLAFAQPGGVEEVTLASTQMPSHGHPYQVSTASATQSAPGGAMAANSVSVDVYREDGVAVSFAPAAITATGGSQPHSNFQPYLCVSFIISLFGIFPSQT